MSHCFESTGLLIWTDSKQFSSISKESKGDPLSNIFCSLKIRILKGFSTIMLFSVKLMLLYCIIIGDYSMNNVTMLFSRIFLLLFFLHLVRLHRYFDPILVFFGEINATLLHYHRRFTHLKLLL